MRPGTSPRRVWIGKLLRVAECSELKEKCCRTTSIAESFEGEPSAGVSINRSKPVERFSCSAHCTRRAVWDSNSERLVDVEVQAAELHLPCKMEEARARCAVLIAAADQAAIDSGNWIMANVSLLEAPPPYQAFSSHTAPTLQELQHSSLLDPRWVEVFLGHIKEQDSYQESKRKLGKGGGKADRDTTERGGAGDPKPGPKKTPKKKAAAGESQAAGEA